MKDVTVKNKIIEATINCIEAYGIEGCTVRNIASEAGINLSSVHYYFESKDELVDAALGAAITGSFEDIERMWQEYRPDYKTALFNILMFLFEGAERYPGITRAGMYPMIMHGKSDTLFITLLNGFLGKAASEISETAGGDRAKLNLWLMEAFSTVMFIGISMKAYRDFSGYDFSSRDQKEQLVSHILERI